MILHEPTGKTFDPAEVEKARRWLSSTFAIDLRDLSDRSVIANLGVHYPGGIEGWSE